MNLRIMGPRGGRASSSSSETSESLRDASSKFGVRLRGRGECESLLNRTGEGLALMGGGEFSLETSALENKNIVCAHLYIKEYRKSIYFYTSLHCISLRIISPVISDFSLSEEEGAQPGEPLLVLAQQLQRLLLISPKTPW